MNSHKLTTMMLLCFVLIGCSPATVTPNNQASPIEVTVITTTPTTSSVAVAPSATLEPDAPAGCVNLTETPLDTNVLNGLLVVYDRDTYTDYFFDPKSTQILDIEDKTQLSPIAPNTDISIIKISPNKKFLQAFLTGKSNGILRTVDKIVKTYDTQGQEDWNRGRWLDNEHMFFQYWAYPNGNTIVIYNPFTGEQKEIQLNLPKPYIVIDGGGKAAWVKADIDHSLTRVLYNDEDERLVLWDLESQREIASLPSSTDLLEGTWSPDGKEFAVPSPLLTSPSTELFTIDMDGTVKKLTDFNQKYPFANVDTRPAWSPDGRRIAYWLKISGAATADPETLQQWLAITDTTTLDTQIYCLSSNKPPATGGNIVWSPDSTKIIVDTDVSSEGEKPVLVDLTHLTQTALDTHGLTVSDWMTP
jgi:dipeptidyl aminopeptidase/acylaminoacyl peptidase